MGEPLEGPDSRGAVGESSAPDLAGLHPAAPTPASVTRGFLFADLRDYTRFVESHGAVAATELLLRYRALVREAVARYRGAEIKTEGDSFYVVFPSVSAAVQCGLAITVGAREDATGGRPADAIQVGVGIHAGETVETPEGYVGAPVNIAARICALARPGQVLVSDTVRALTQTMLAVDFTPLGRRPLKGVKEPLMLYVAAAADPAATARATARRRRSSIARWAALGLIVVVLGAGAIWWQTRPAAALPPGPWTIGVQVPLGPDDHDFGQALVNAVKLAVDDANASGDLAPAQLVLDARDEGAPDNQALASDAITAWVADPRVIATVGPNRSSHAKTDIPITNRAGLLQCSPGTTNPALTKPRFGATDLRSAFPTRINFVRLATSDDIQGPAAASFAFYDLHARQALVVDDTSPGGREVADSFQTAFEALEPAIAASGSATYRKALNPGATDFSAIIDPIRRMASARLGSSVVYYGGFPESGIAPLKQAIDAAGGGVIPLLSWDALHDGSGTDAGSFIQTSGADAARSYATQVSIAPVPASFDARYRSVYGKAPDQYAGAANACAQIIIDGLRAIAPSSPDAATLREALRASVVDPSHRYDTVLGNVGFDANGDSIHQYVTFYRTDLGALGGKGDWIVVKQQDFAPIP